MKTGKSFILGDKKAVRRGQRKLRRKLAFTAVIAFVLSYGAWAIGMVSGHTRIQQAFLDIARIEHAVRLFRADLGRCPASLEELLRPESERRYLAGAVDPWGQAYTVHCPSRRDPGGADVTSYGPDRSPDGADNISSL